jgi:hypothetical protein
LAIFRGFEFEFQIAEDPLIRLKILRVGSTCFPWKETIGKGVEHFGKLVIYSSLIVFPRD